MKLIHNRYFLFLCGVCALVPSVWADTEYTDIWAYQDTLTANGELQRTGLEFTSKIKTDGSTEVVVTQGDHNDGDICGGKIQESVTATNVTINGGTNIKRIIGGNSSCGYVQTDRNITVNGGEADYIYGGDWYVEPGRGPENPDKYVDGFYSKETYGVLSSTGVWCPKKSNGDINITVNGGTIGQIRGGHNCAEGVNIDPNKSEDIGWSEDADGNATAKRPYAVGGDVNIVLTGGTVGKEGQSDAIRGAGGSWCSVDGNVNITVADDANVIGNIYAGARNKYGQVGGTSISIAGGTVTGNVYGGGSYDGYQTTTQGDTSIELSGGTVTGSIYAAGNKDIVEGGTKVTVLGEGTKLSEDSVLSGGGINGATVSGIRELIFDNPDIEVASSFTIADFDTLTMTNGSTANLKTVAGQAINLDNLTLQFGATDGDYTYEINWENIDTQQLTLAIQSPNSLTRSTGSFNLEDVVIYIDGGGWDFSDCDTLVYLIDEAGQQTVLDDVQLVIENDGAIIRVASVPEPTTATLSLLALAALAARRRRK